MGEGYGLELLRMGLGRRSWDMGIRLHVSRAVAGVGAGEERVRGR